MDDATLIRRFEAAQIPRSEWTHRMHVRMAFLYLRDHGFDDALQRIRQGIVRLNRQNAVPEHRTSGFHETLTEAWARLVRASMPAAQAPPELDSETFAEAHPLLLSPRLLRLYYSRERIGSEAAKRGFVAPDLEPLPEPAREDAAPTAPELRALPLHAELARALVAALNAELSRRYPEPGATHFRLDPEEVAAGRGVFLAACVGGRGVACGALRLLEAGRAELKRMYVVPALRGRGLGALMLAALEREARRLGARVLVLETAVRQLEALALYRRAGFEQIDPFGEYVNSPLSVCMQKRLSDP